MIGIDVEWLIAHVGLMCRSSRWWVCHCNWQGRPVTGGAQMAGVPLLENPITVVDDEQFFFVIKTVGVSFFFNSDNFFFRSNQI